MTETEGHKHAYCGKCKRRLPGSEEKEGEKPPRHKAPDEDGQRLTDWCKDGVVKVDVVPFAEEPTCLVCEEAIPLGHASMDRVHHYVVFEANGLMDNRRRGVTHLRMAGAPVVGGIHKDCIKKPKNRRRRK